MPLRCVLFLIVGISLSACQLLSPAAEPLRFSSYEDFERSLHNAASNGEVDRFWEGLRAAGEMPLIFGERVVFLHRADAQAVYWHGEWMVGGAEEGIRVEGTDVWMMEIQLPLDARTFYLIQVDDQAPMIDPLNADSNDQVSVVIMPEYEPPTFIEYRDDVPHGILQREQTVSSTYLGYDVRYRVYVPPEVYQAGIMPTLYMTDGDQYISFGMMVNALDNLIAEGKIQPIVAVFIDPRSPISGINQREAHLLDNPDYGMFISEELVPIIDANYAVDPSPDARAILGMSYGGYHSAYFALTHADQFHLIGIQSPVIPINIDSTLLEDHAETEPLPINKVYLSTGTLGDATEDARALRDIFEQKGYDMLYLETHEGHHFGNWQGQFDDVLIYFFGTG